MRLREHWTQTPRATCCGARWRVRMLTCARVGPGTLGVRAEEPRSSRPASLGLPPGQLTAQCGTVRSARAASRRRAPRWVPRVRPVAMAGLVVSGTQVSYIGQDCREIPEHLGRDCGHFAKRLDLSFNLLSLPDLESLGLAGPREMWTGYEILREENGFYREHAAIKKHWSRQNSRKRSGY
ncbi:Lysine-specific histone demethylase 1A [Manis javanica]|nr:Lysine-specific histone demethylase 1A [Manis javanica]